MTEECGKMTLVREGRNERLLYTPETPAEISKKGWCPLQSNTLRFPRDIPCSTGLSVCDRNDTAFASWDR